MGSFVKQNQKESKRSQKSIEYSQNSQKSQNLDTLLQESFSGPEFLSFFGFLDTFLSWGAQPRKSIEKTKKNTPRLPQTQKVSRKQKKKQQTNDFPHYGGLVRHSVESLCFFCFLDGFLVWGSLAVFFLFSRYFF